MTPLCINSNDHGKAALLQAARALAALARTEYGERYTLVEAAGTWGGGVTPEQLEALAHCESLLLEAPLELLDHRAQGLDVEAP